MVPGGRSQSSHGNCSAPPPPPPPRPSLPNTSTASVEDGARTYRPVMPSAAYTTRSLPPVVQARIKGLPAKKNIRSFMQATFVRCAQRLMHGAATHLPGAFSFTFGQHSEAAQGMLAPSRSHFGDFKRVSGHSDGGGGGGSATAAPWDPPVCGRSGHPCPAALPCTMLQHGTMQEADFDWAICQDLRSMEEKAALKALQRVLWSSSNVSIPIRNMRAYIQKHIHDVMEWNVAHDRP
ncbi:MAG: hypothetical protein WDW36_003733 [Sanguina aurantia]